MKKPPKRKRFPQRRGAIDDPFMLHKKSHELWRAAHQRAVQECMPPDVLADYLELRLLVVPDRLNDEQAERLRAIIEEYEPHATDALIAKHIADIERERGEA